MHSMGMDGIEPSSAVLETDILPLNYIRSFYERKFTVLTIK